MTVANYSTKFNNICNWSKRYKQFKKCKIKNFFLGKPKKKKQLNKPVTMLDVVSTDSDSDKNDTFKGLSGASKYLGEGAVLYLQTMKTLTILFLILTVINIPVMVMYANATSGNEYEKANTVLNYLTIGNIAKPN